MAGWTRDSNHAAALSSNPQRSPSALHGNTTTPGWASSRISTPISAVDSRTHVVRSSPSRWSPRGR